MKKSELHLIVLWENARSKEQEILDDIKSCLLVRQIYEITWTPDLVSNNFSRFYGTKLPPNSGKEIDCGKGSFLCIIVEDKNPCYQFMETSRGHEYVNKNIFELKLKYRSWVGGSRIHTTNSIQEINHDAALLLGLNYGDLGKSLPDRWDEKFKKIHRDITGAKNWKDLDELFYTLNATTDYVVLRGFNVIKNQHNPSEILDIDVLTSDYENCSFIINGVPSINKERPHFLVKANGIDIYVDVWNTKNLYYDSRWTKDMLETRRISDNDIYELNPQNQFYEFIYHCLIHKNKIREDYYTTAYCYFSNLELDQKYDVKKYSNPFDLYFQLLKDFMNKKGYSFVKPLDSSVFYSKELAQIDDVYSFLEKKYTITDLELVQPQLVGWNKQLFLKGFLNKVRIFLKVGTHKEIYKNEYKMAHILYDLDPNHFVKPLLWRENNDLSFVVFEYIEGIPLDKYIATNPSNNIKSDLIEDLFQIFLDMKLSNVVHRDIRPANFIVSNGHLKLIDCQLAVSKTNYKELNYLEKSGLWLGLGEDYCVESGVWDDAHSLLKTLEFIGSDKSYQSRYQEIYTNISDYVGQASISYIPKMKMKSLILKLIEYKLKSVFATKKKKRHKYHHKYKELKKAFFFKRRSKKLAIRKGV